MKTNAIIRIIIHTIVFLLLLGILTGCIMMGGFPFRFFGSSLSGGTVSSTGRFPADQIRDIEIEWVAGSVTIQPGETDQILIRESSNHDKDDTMVWKHHGNKLTIHYTDRIALFGTTAHSKDLVITVPADWICGELSIDHASADLNIYSLNADTADLDGASGTYDLRDCHFDELDIDTASGDIRYSGTLKTLSCDAVSADLVCVFENVPRSIDMDGVSGNLDVTLPADCGFRVDMDALSGEFSSDFDTRSDDGDYLYGNGGCETSVDGISGSVIIRKADTENAPS